MEEDESVVFRQKMLAITEDMFEFNEKMKEKFDLRYFKIKRALQSIRIAVDMVNTYKERLAFLEFFSATINEILIDLELEKIESRLLREKYHGEMNGKL